MPDPVANPGVHGDDQPSRRAQSACTAASRLSDVQLAVVRLSRGDTLSSLADREARGRRLARLFGIRTSNPLADPGLEALRRYAVTIRLRHGDGDYAVEPLLAAGYSAGQVAAVDHLVASWGRTNGRRLRWAVWVTSAGGAAALYAFVANAIDDPLMALVAVGSLVATAAPLLLPKRAGG